MKALLTTRLLLVVGLIAVLVGAGSFGLAGCGRRNDNTAQNTPANMPAELHVMDVKLGRSIDGNKRIISATEEFSPTETVYASVETMGSAPSATLVARWSYEDGQLVDESSQTIAPSGTAVTEFHVAKPSGWPAGKYKLEVLLDGKSAATKEFTVRT